MATLISREDFGFHDDGFTGFLYAQEGLPVLQVHEYEDYWTFFWRGRARIQQLIQSLGELAEALEKAFNRPRNSFNRVLVEYSIMDDFTQMPWYLYPQNVREESEDTLHRRFLNENFEEIDFVRFDIMADIPIILWADLIDDPSSEVGFSSVLLPSPIFDLLRETCRISIPANTLVQLEDEITELTAALVR